QDRRIAHDDVASFEALGGTAVGELTHVGGHVVAHESPGEPREERVDSAVAKEEELRPEPGTQVRTGLMQPAEDVHSAEKDREVRDKRNEQERHRSLGEPNDDA